MNLPTPDTAIPADQIDTITPSQVLADARAAGARPEHVLDAVAVAVAAVLEPVMGTDFHHLLSGTARDVQILAHGWLRLHHDIDPNLQPIDYATLTSEQVAGMLDHVGAEFARVYDRYVH